RLVIGTLAGGGQRVELVAADRIGLGQDLLEALPLDILAHAVGERADNEAIDLYAFTSVLKRHLDAEARKAFIGLMWEIVYADG
ncbi:TerB family tellurite resistance protein, partial [Mesorhizobium sp. M1A.F.Ca.IN.020.30.1.1]|uniref:tellurite resistance TerB family protein n=1 Tax=Mesorhizobium sp. M1A.F.Ca.IN.020.30.1.1 TaxID=2496762 RepID=UPI001FE12876